MKSNEISKIIKEEREKQGLSQRRLEEIANVSARTIMLWEKNYRGMTVDNAEKILNALGKEISIKEVSRHNE